MTFWENVPAVCLTTWSTVLCLRPAFAQRGTGNRDRARRQDAGTALARENTLKHLELAPELTV